MIEELIRIDEQGVKVQIQDLVLPVCVRARDDLPWVLATYTVISSDKPSSSKHPKGFKECKWQPIGMNDLKEIKQAVVSYDLHSPFISEMGKVWESSNKAIPHNWLLLVSAVMEDGLQVL